jgi:hypothetical protein
VERGSGGKQDTASQQIEAGTAVRLSLEQLELVDLAFRLTAAPGRSQRGVHGRDDLFETYSECLDGTHTARARFVEPALPLGNRCFCGARPRTAAAAHDSREPASQFGDPGYIRALLDPCSNGCVLSR